MVILVKFFKEMLSCDARWQSVGRCLKKLWFLLRWRICRGNKTHAIMKFRDGSLFLFPPSDVGVATCLNLFLLFRDRAPVQIFHAFPSCVHLSLTRMHIRPRCMTQFSFNSECSKATGYDSAEVMTILSNAICPRMPMRNILPSNAD